MAGAPIRFLFDYISHNAYLAWTQLGAIAARHGREVEPEPVLFAGLLNAHGQLGPAEIPSKARWMMRDVARKARRLGVPFARPASHPFPPLLALRVTLAAERGVPRTRLVAHLFHEVWALSVDISDLTEVARIAREAGGDSDALLARAASDSVKRELRDATDAAVREGVFGVPTFLVDGELFWGFDDLVHLELFLEGRDPLARAERAALLDYRPTARRRRPEEK